MVFKQSLQENKSIRLNATTKNWQEAIKIGTDLLEKSGAIDPSYYEAIITNVKKMGPYIIIAPQLAMPHARPEDGVNKTAFALVTLKEPVYFDGEESPIDVFITLAGSSNDEHLEGLTEVISLVEDEESETGINLDPFKHCQTEEELYQLIDNKLNQ